VFEGRNRRSSNLVFRKEKEKGEARSKAEEHGKEENNIDPTKGSGGAREST